MKESGFQLLWCDESNYQIIFVFDWVQDLEIIDDEFFLFGNYNFVNEQAVVLFYFNVQWLHCKQLNSMIWADVLALACIWTIFMFMVWYSSVDSNW